MAQESGDSIASHCLHSREAGSKEGAQLGLLPAVYLMNISGLGMLLHTFIEWISVDHLTQSI